MNQTISKAIKKYRGRRKTTKISFIFSHEIHISFKICIKKYCMTVCKYVLYEVKKAIKFQVPINPECVQITRTNL